MVVPPFARAMSAEQQPIRCRGIVNAAAQRISEGRARQQPIRCRGIVNAAAQRISEGRARQGSAAADSVPWHCQCGGAANLGRHGAFEGTSAQVSERHGCLAIR